ncbi:MAG: amidohydrolase [Flavobacteriales bacterium]|nr:MAG: amidohydrolase [Flavobacteriales bacterium]
MKKLKTIILYSFGCATILSCNNQIKTPADTIYYNGDIISMTSENDYLEAIAIKDGNILYTGTLDKASIHKGETTIMIDLKGKTMLPGFIDAHCHFAGFPAQAVGAKILPPPDAGVKSIKELITTLKEWATPENIELTGWIFGMGMDDTMLEEKRFPTKDDLDEVSKDIPVIAIHISGHLAVINSKGLELLGINASTPDPKGGRIRRVKGSNEPNGVLEELAIIPLMPTIINPRSMKAAKIFLDSGQDLALSYGYTTIQEGRAFESTHAFLEQAAKAHQLKIDVVSYIDHTVDKLLESEWYGLKYNNHYRIGGVKLALDGSPQGRTAWLTHPYHIPPEGADKYYDGYPIIPNDSVVQNIYDKAYKNNWQIITHCNGDAAMDQMIRTLTPITEKYEHKDRRTVLIHGQYVRDDQLDSYKKLDVIASLFPLHTFYWGDWHKQLIGDSLGNKISPTRTALDKGLKLTIHSDAPIALPNLMRVVWTAVNRTSRSGAIIGENERLTPFEALKCITDWSAYQHFEENEKGTLEVGKIADLVILTDNPLKVKPNNIKDIKVLETIKNGESIYVKGE